MKLLKLQKVLIETLNILFIVDFSILFADNSKQGCCKQYYPNFLSFTNF